MRRNKEDNARYYQLHKEEILKYNKEWRERNPQKWSKLNRENVRTWRLKNPERRKDYDYLRYYRLKAERILQHEKKETQVV